MMLKCHFDHLPMNIKQRLGSTTSGQPDMAAKVTSRKFLHAAAQMTYMYMHEDLNLAHSCTDEVYVQKCVRTTANVSTHECAPACVYSISPAIGCMGYNSHPWQTGLRRQGIRPPSRVAGCWPINEKSYNYFFWESSVI